MSDSKTTTQKIFLQDAIILSETEKAHEVECLFYKDFSYSRQCRLRFFVPKSMLDTEEMSIPKWLGDKIRQEKAERMNFCLGFNC